MPFAARRAVLRLPPSQFGYTTHKQGILDFLVLPPPSIGRAIRLLVARPYDHPNKPFVFEVAGVALEMLTLRKFPFRLRIG